ncbi:replication initiation protein [Janthinobacterium sp. CG_23.4]|uniref:replication initiation protein n=1 Tax=Janthinobacterium sp. CG_23.4 TaxID=2760707 RepID=UPI00247431C5|nr:replication initiation protein [Janthinobacterium sp. CG_23.4]MDH6155964.1 hypothetical protein [Janthinobacterium sp. CG_23.4]
MASAALIALVQAQAPKRPYCAFVKNNAIVRRREIALAAPYLQLNPPAHRSWIILDIDRSGASHAWEDAALPVPTYCAINRENGHAHIGYALSAPVCTSAAARLAPLRYLAAIEYAYTAKVHADAAFTGPLAKNPIHPKWQLWEPANAPVYELGYLADFVDLTTKQLPRDAGLGRNCDLFDGLRDWAYSAVRQFWRPRGEDLWRAAVRLQAESLNTFTVPLNSSEVAGIARSVARYVWRRYTPTKFREVQAARGRLGGIASGAARLISSEDKRVSARLMAANGMSTRAIADELVVGKSTVARWVSHEAISGNSTVGFNSSA